MESLKRKARSNPRLRDFLVNPNQPGYQIIRHPSFLSKPVNCVAGLHKGLQFRMIDGILSYYCTKCGMSIAQGIHDGTWTKADIRRIRGIRQEQQKPKTKEESLKESWEALELLRAKFTQKQINEMVNRRWREKHGIK